ncbi:MAG: DUF998 domain-containing protein [Deltaproteobacteria bacterium]|nr:DUF998 domain-containing protein [Deltaproteobacteria bacterium]
MARMAVWCSAGLFLSLVLVHALRPDLDASWRPISEYALGAHGWLMTLAFACWGLGPIALALSLRGLAPTRSAKIAIALLVLGGVGPLLAALFPMDPLSTSPGAMTWSGRLHASGAVLGDLIPVAALILSFALTRPNGRWAAYGAAVRASATVAFGLLVAATAAMAAMMPESGQLGSEVKVGWLMRAFVVACNAWVAAGAWATLRARA